MRLYRSLSAVDETAPEVARIVTVGAYDGLHLGHQEILSRVKSAAAETGARATILSFEPMPTEFFAPGKPPARLTCLRERVELLQRMGLDEMLCPRFSAMRNLSGDEFVDDVLVARLGTTHIIVGDDFKYGRQREGTIDTLRAAGRAHGFAVTAVDPVYCEGLRISSTEIRQALGRGDLTSARRMLGRDYSMSGRVVYGRNLGKQLGFPTANVNLKRRVAPVDGIFAVEVTGIGDQSLPGVASVGSRPTIGEGETLLEVYLFDFDRDIYGRYITVHFIARLREERKFDDLTTLKAQMHIDVREAQAALEQRIA